MFRFGDWNCVGWMLVAVCGLAMPSRAVAAPLEVGEVAPDAHLTKLDGSMLQLGELCAQGPVVLVFLRGYPGYQCPICSMQVNELMKQAEAFASAKAQVVLVYPGPAEQLDERAKQFVGKRLMPAHFHLVVDPDYVATLAYDLRWDAPRETAYPSTFVLDSQRRVKLAVVSKSHGGRAKTADVLTALKNLE